MKVKKSAIGIIILFVVINILIYLSLNLKSEDETSETNVMITSANESNIEGLSLMDEGKFEEAVDYFDKALEYAEEYNKLEDGTKENEQAGILLSDAYNNLCYAYCSLYKYDISLEYGEKALSFEPNDDYEYANLGNTLYGLNRNEEAMKYYQMAIDKNANARFAYYGMGCIYFDLGEWENALEMFNEYLKYEPLDVDTKLYIIDCNTNLGNYEEALELTDQAIESKFLDNRDIEFYEAKGEILNASTNYEETKTFYETTAETFRNIAHAQILLGEFYYNNEQYQLALEHFLEKQYLKNPEIDGWIIYCYEGLDEINNALDYYQKAVDQERESYELSNAVGNVHINKTMYMESIKYFDEAIRLDPEGEDAYLNKTYALFYGKRYSKCIEFGKLAQEKFTNNYDIVWYIGECYYNLSNYEEALIYFKSALELDPENSQILSDIAYTYLMLEDYQKAEIYADQCLAINSENTSAIDVKQTIIDRENPMNDQMKELIRDSYLYYEDEKEIEERINELFTQENMSNLEIAIALDETKQADDIFTFVLFDDDYDYYSNINDNDVVYNQYDDISYIKIYGFNVNTDNKVIEILDEIEDPESKILAIDLRGNSGGITQCANNMLDVLLPEYVTSTLIDREGYTFNFYSDASWIKFDKIYVLVDENSASASELLALGLRTYLNNVTIIGRNTYGKGVGQIVFEDKERRLMVFLVNHYWNVRQQNIMNTNIAPDIYVQTDDLEDYLKVIKED